MKRIAIIYYTKSGNTEKMADLISEGVQKDENVKGEVYKVQEFPIDKTKEYDALIVGSPTYYGTMAYEIKKFLDETVAVHGSLAGKVGGAFASAMNIGGGNETTVLSIIQAMLIHGMIVQGNEKGDHYGPVSIGRPDTRVETQCRDLGNRIAGLVQSIG